MNTDVLIIGGGPSGLTAAASLRRQTDADVVVIEREADAGGIPRHSSHLGYGMRDLHTVTSGPKYASRLVDQAASCGVRLQTDTMVTAWDPQEGATCVSPSGITRVTATATLLTTGARERPRTARMIPGGRPAGVYTTGELQNAVHLHHHTIGSRAVIIGAQLVSWSAMLTLKESGCSTVAVTSEYQRPESYGIFNLGGRIMSHAPVLTSTRVVEIIGRTRVTGVQVEDIHTRQQRTIACDTIVTTGDWIPDHELARSGGLTLDPGTRGPLVDPVGRTSRQGIFAAGNTVHPVDTADVAAIGGRHAAEAIAQYLNDPRQDDWLSGDRIEVNKPLRWVSPGLYHPTASPARHKLLLWTDDHVRTPTVTAKQDGRLIGRRRLPWPASPGRVFRAPWSLLSKAAPGRGPITISL